jgi:hypothetical protein
MTFIVGFDYTREAIHAQCGGSLQSELPHQNGRVVAACLDASRNPHAPCVILCGNRPDLCQAGALLAQQPAPIPVFIKNAAQRWVYQGGFEVAESFTAPADCAPYLAGSGRDFTTISRVIVLRMI